MKRYCPFCKSLKPMVKDGFIYYRNVASQRWKCKNKMCGRRTIAPLKEKV